MDLKLIHTFVTAAKENNLTKTAQLLGYAQSTITTQIKQLEEEIGCNLFDRFGKSIYLSTDGKAFLPYAKRLLSLEQEIKDSFSSSYDQAPLTIGASQSISNTILPSIVGRFQSLYPKTPLMITLDNSEHLHSLLLTDEIDVAICMKNIALDKELMVIETKKEPLSFYASSKHPLKDIDPLTFSTLCDYPFLLTAKDCYYHKTLVDFLEKKDLIPHILLESDNINLLKQFAMNGLGILFLPDIAVQEELQAHKLIKLTPINAIPFTSQSHILLHKQKYKNISLERFLTLAKEYFSCLSDTESE